MRVLSIVLLLAAPASAQPAPAAAPSAPPPATTAPAPPSEPPPAAPPPAATTPAVPVSGASHVVRPAPSVMDNRWAVAVGLGLQSLAPKLDGGAPSTGFVTFELSGRYRVARPIELGLSLGGGTAGNASMSELFLDFRYRFWAERAFNIFAGASLGAAAAYDKTNETDDTKHGRGALRFVGGTEWRFDTLALTAELRLLGIAENGNFQGAPITNGDMLARYGIGGGALVLGATYYF
jgi:hypothetical protein